ncbi:hypothetical protein ABUE31_20420 [Mesorhizobium sp. ZMM04-5]|uniref:7-cyano-7-deazaguanine synthase n=1 Tax=Mesorhizobium marinum TaxID=3228790 RepID=A0ABV3R5W4_9HYPH
MDGLVLGILYWAMRNRIHLDVAGPMSRESLANILELQTAIHSIHGPLYLPIDVVPQMVVDPVEPLQSAALSLFSGGVDSIFTLLRHTSESALPVRSVLLIHHQELDRGEDYVDRLINRTKPLLEEVGVDTLVQTTNLRHATSTTVMPGMGQRYFECFGAQLSASLHQYAGHYGHGLTGSNEPYTKLVMEVGSTPATDWLLSSSTMRIVHDGAAFTRTEKVAAIARHPTARKVVHVCLDHPFLNCGRCMKCVRTRMNFLAVGIDEPECFDGSFDLALIDQLKIKKVTTYLELVSILESARKNGTTGAWSRRLASRLRWQGRGSIASNVRKGIALASQAVANRRAPKGDPVVETPATRSRANTFNS